MKVMQRALESNPLCDKGMGISRCIILDVYARRDLHLNLLCLEVTQGVC